MAKLTRQRRASRIRHQLREVTPRGVARLTVFRSNAHIYAQIINDVEGKTIVSASTIDKKLRKDITNSSTVDAASKVGAELASRAKAAGVKQVYFDRSGFRYHGQVKALADAARENGLKF